MSNTFKCSNCGRDGLTDANPWHNCYEAAEIAEFETIIDAWKLVLDLRTLATFGIDTDTRARATAQLPDARATFRRLIGEINGDKLVRFHAYHADQVGANVFIGA